LSARWQQVAQAPWDMNTNLEAAFKAILDHAKKYYVRCEDMPTTLIILSDMEFDACVSAGPITSRFSYSRGYSVDPYARGSQPVNQTLFENLRTQYEASGYRLPKVVFWNLSSRHKNFPVTIRDEGTALISGFSPTIVKQVLGGRADPHDIMMETIMVDRYMF